MPIYDDMIQEKVKRAFGFDNTTEYDTFIDDVGAECEQELYDDLKEIAKQVNPLDNSELTNNVKACLVALISRNLAFKIGDEFRHNAAKADYKEKMGRIKQSMKVTPNNRAKVTVVASTYQAGKLEGQ